MLLIQLSVVVLASLTLVVSLDEEFDLNMRKSYMMPFSGHIPFVMGDGRVIVIDGYTPEITYKNRFAINLCIGEKCQASNHLHFDVRFDERVVVRNHHERLRWGEEERSGRFPFHQTAAFTIAIYGKRYGYQVLINGAFFVDFHHRLPMEDIRFVTITGEVNITKVDYVINKPKVPMSIYVYGIYQTDWIFVKGITTDENAKRFIVTLVCGSSYEENDNAFSMEVLYNYESSVNKIIFKFKAGGFWSDPTEHSSFPFTIDSDFELGIKVDLESFKVYVGNVYLTQTDHSIEGADFLDIRGDVTVNKIIFK